MSEINSYRDLLVWRQAVDLAADIYKLTRTWPREEAYGLTSQARRAAVSIAANIAEGYGRENRGSYLHFLKMAQGSLKELETHLLIAVRVELLSSDAVNDPLSQAESIGKLALMRKLEPDANV